MNRIASLCTRSALSMTVALACVGSMAHAANGTYVELYRFSQASRSAPHGRLTLKSGRLLGVTRGSYSVYPDVGTVYSFGVANP